QIDGNIVVGADPTRDGIWRAAIPITVRGSEPGSPPIATAPAGMDLLAFHVTAKTTSGSRTRLTYKLESTSDVAGRPRTLVTIGGTIGHGNSTSYYVPTRERTATAAYAVRAALRAHGVSVTGDLKVAELADYVATAAAAGSLPVELGRHESA